MQLGTESAQSDPRALFFQRAYPHYQAAQRGAPEYLRGAKKLLEQLQVRVGALSGHRRDAAHSDCCPKAQSKNAGFLFISFNKYELSRNYELCPECWKEGKRDRQDIFGDAVLSARSSPSPIISWSPVLIDSTSCNLSHPSLLCAVETFGGGGARGLALVRTQTMALASSVVTSHPASSHLYPSLEPEQSF